MNKIFQEIKGKQLLLDGATSFCDIPEIKKQFDVTENEILNENGLTGCIYNKIALKDLK